MVYNLWCRGITTWPYYFDSREDLDMFFLSGVSGLTTNLVQYIELSLIHISRPMC